MNCGRSPHHKCCKQIEEKKEQPDVTTTTEAAVTEINPASTIFGITTLRDGDVEEDFATPDILLTVKEARKDEVTMDYASKEEKFTMSLLNFIDDSTTINSIVEKKNVAATSVPVLEFITPKVEAEEEEYVDKAVENGSGNEGEEEEGMEEAQEEKCVRERDKEGSVCGVSGKEDSKKDKPIIEFLDGSGGEETTVVPMKIMHDVQRIDAVDILQKEHATLASQDRDEIDYEDQIPAEEKIHHKEDAEEEIHSTDKTMTSSADTLESFLETYSTSPVPEMTQRVIAPVYVPAWRKRQEGKEEEGERREEEKSMRQDADIKSQRVVFQLSDAPSLMYTEIDNSLDPNGLGDSETEDHDYSLDSEDDWSSDWTDCREFDCLVSPSHLCCSPHATEKRQTGAEGWQGGGPRVTVLSLPGFNSLVAPLVLEYPGRVTATVTRVEKSYSWSKWKKIYMIDNFL